MLSRSTLKAELIAFRDSLKPPQPDDKGRLVGNRNSADLQLLDRWIARCGGAPQIVQPPILELGAVLFEASVDFLLCFRPAGKSRVVPAKDRLSVFAALSRVLNDGDRCVR